MAFYTLYDWPLRIGGGIAVIGTPGYVDPVVISSPIGGVAISSIAGNMIVTVNRACTIHWRIKSGSAPTNKVTEFTNAEVVTAAGTYTFPSGVLVQSTLYYGAAWAEDDELNETAIISNVIYTTPATSSNVIASAVYINGVATAAFTIPEDTQVGAVLFTLTANGVPACTFTELADVDNKFTVASNGVVTLSAALNFAADSSHPLQVRANNSSGNYDPTLTGTVLQSTTGGGGTITPDATVGSLAALDAQLVSWNNTGSATRYIKVTNGSYGALAITNKTFTAPVVIYSENESHGAVFAGITITGCTFVHLYAVKSLAAVVKFVNTCTDCAFTDSVVRKSDSIVGATRSSAALQVEGSDNCVAIRLNISRNLIMGWENGFNFRPNTGSVDNIIDDNIITDPGSDCMRISGQHSRTKFRRNWMGRCIRNSSPGDHADCLQWKGGDTMEFWGNVILTSLKKDDYVGDPVMDKNFMAFRGGTNAGNSTINSVIGNNIIIGTHVNIMNPGMGAGCVATYNEGLRVPSSGGGAADININGFSDYNIFTTNNDNGQVGTNGLWIAFTDNTTLRTHYVGKVGGDVFDEYTTIGMMMPPSSASRRHWNYATPANRVGPFLRLKEINDGLHPGNHIGEIGTWWHARFNPDNLITS